MADIFGTTGSDALSGAVDNDFILGGLGDDLLEGDAGDDELVGGDGIDTLDGGDGDDGIWAGSGQDIIDGGAGIDTAIYANDGDSENAAPQGVAVDLAAGTAVDGWGFADTITGVENVVGTSLADTLTGDSQDNELTGLEGDDILSGGSGDDLIYGDDGNDTINGDDGDDSVFAGVGSDIANGGAGDDFLDGDAGEDTLHGNAGDDEIVGGNGNDFLFGDDGDDFFWGAEGEDLINGGAGYDTVVFQNDGFGNEVAAGVSIDLAAGTAVDGWGGTDTLVSIESIYATNFTDNFVGNAGATDFYGGGGDDTIAGGVALAHSAADYLFGGDGNDAIRINSGFVYGGAGNDRILGQSTTSAYAMAAVSYFDAATGIVANLTAISRDGLSDGNNTSGYRVSDGLGGIDLISDLHIIKDGDFDDVFYVDSSWKVGGTNFVQIRLSEGDDSVEFFNVANAAISYAESGGGVRADLFVGTATDTATGADFVGDDTFSGVGHFFGSDFADRIEGSFDDETISGNAGNDVIDGSMGDDSLFGGAGNDTLRGGIGGGNDGLFGGAGNDTLEGDIGNDWLDGEAGVDILRGGFGDDVYVVDTTSDTIDEADERFGDDEVHSYVSFSLKNSARVVGDFERLYLQGTADINGTGNALDNVLVGNSGANILIGGAGDDWLDGKASNDTMRGGGDDDVYIVSSSSDTIDEMAPGSSGTDEVHSSIGFNLNTSARVLGNFEKLFLTGSSNISGTGNALNNIIGGNSGSNILTGNAGNDGLSGNKGNDTLSGGKGNDTLDGGAGKDTMKGGAGNDDYVVDNSRDIVNEGASGSSGRDTVFSSISFNLNKSGTVLGSVERLQLTGGGNVNGTGNSLNNTIYGNSGANKLVGDAGNDSLYGNGGNDRITSGAGNDQLAGGSGKDTFVFNAALSKSANVDHLIDFNPKDDVFWLDNAVMKALGGTGNLSSSMFWKSTSGTAHDSSDRIIYDTDHGRLYYDSNGNASGGSVLIATLNPHLGITASDFIVI